MAKTCYINARILVGNGEVIENGILVVRHEQSTGKLPVLSDTLEFAGPQQDWELSGEEEIIDCQGYTLMPGLYDVDSHLDTLNTSQNDYVDNLGTAYRTYISFRNASEALVAGVTALRITGMPDGIDLALKSAYQKNMVFGPTLFVSGPEYTTTAGYGTDVYGTEQCSGANAFRGAARVNLSHGLDLLHLCISSDRRSLTDGEYEKQMSDSEIAALTDLAHAFGKPVSAHCAGDASIQTALCHNITCVEHGLMASEETVRSMAQAGAYFVPALCSTESYDEQTVEEHRSMVRMAIEQKVRICVGTNGLASEPAVGTTAVIRELELLCELGMSGMDAIISATSNSASLCGDRNGGLLKAGKRPDFIAVKGNPDQDIHLMRNLALVVKNGRTVYSGMAAKAVYPFHIHAPSYSVKGGTTHIW